MLLAKTFGVLFTGLLGRGWRAGVLAPRGFWWHSWPSGDLHAETGAWEAAWRRGRIGTMPAGLGVAWSSGGAGKARG